MSVRRLLNRHGHVVVLVVAAIIGLCAWVTWTSAHPDVGAKPLTIGYFTLDDGKSWSVGSLTALATLNADGRPSVRAHIYRCGEGAPVVGYLERYTDRWWALRAKHRDEPQPPPGVRPPWADEFATLGAGALEVKRPGDADWISMADPTACDITSFSCKGGTSAVEVLPVPPRATASVSNKE